MTAIIISWPSPSPAHNVEASYLLARYLSNQKEHKILCHPATWISLRRTISESKCPRIHSKELYDRRNLSLFTLAATALTWGCPSSKSRVSASNCCCKTASCAAPPAIGQLFPTQKTPPQMLVIACEKVCILRHCHHHDEISVG